MASYNHPGASRNPMEEMLLQQLRGQGHSESNQSDEARQEPTSHGQYQHQPQPQVQSGYMPHYDGTSSHGGHGSNAGYDDDSDDIMPPAPTPPVNNMPPGVLAYMSSTGGNTIGAPRAPPNSEHTNNLLNLLRFQQTPASTRPDQGSVTASAFGQQSQGMQPQQQQQSQQQSQHSQQSSPHSAQAPMTSTASNGPHIVAPGPSSQEPTGLLAAMMNGAPHPEDAHKDTPPPSSYAKQPTSPPSDDTSYLLELLNRPKPAQTNQQQPSPQQQQPLQHHSQQVQPSHQQADPARQAQQPFSDSAKSSKSITLTPQSTNDSIADYHHQMQPLPSVFHNTQSPPYSRNSGSYSYQHQPHLEQTQHAPDATLAHPQAMPAHMVYNNNNNPFTDAARSSPMDKTPKSSSVTPAAPASIHSHHSPVDVLKKSSAAASPRSAVMDVRSSGERSIPPTPEHARHDAHLPDTMHVDRAPVEMPTPGSKESVAAAVSGLGEKVDREVQEALAIRAEEEQLDAESGADEVKSQPDMPEDDDRADVDDVIQHQAPVHESVQATKHSVREPEQVVDSWEQAEAEVEGAAAENGDSEVVPVYNFPMRPWIGLKLVENDKIDRPAFHEENDGNITRLKKDFDQIDRNLVTASENHIVYGMSKAGGLRVVRQDDGRDAKLFAATNDRIFNVSMSVSPATDPPVKEAVIGTGVTGTVYWSLIQDGDEDHIFDANPEQYGFALPPINSQEGDAPGGVLKTRARPSSMHPEFFAIGRGKTINIIWPSLIIEQQVLKAPKHDRMVDVDKLLETCSLKINTGKAGKDFTFSADDSTIVTLDKSGRVRFWDIRNLTTPVSEDCPNLPKNTNLELTDSSYFINTISDAEKPWPTSVLLVDKPKPYQRRTAQRYLIVGTKQNHSFQLWDLCLRKVVQEINLPHSKDSDAACSIMYHASTGMIIIGHPTRNSVYFMHLSAPKYNLKISQIEYVSRLAASEGTLPMPDCTAVLSGYREISFSNTGILRSLDLLPTAATPVEPDEPILFELYAMHSKGVACIHVRQRDLGWTTDNRVCNPIDAMDAGVVTISKITSPNQQPLGRESGATSDSVPAPIPIRVIQRKDAPDEAATILNPRANSTRAGPENTILGPKTDVVVDPTPTILPAPAVEKPERPERVRGKRKKAAAADDKSNTNSPRPGPKESKNSAQSQAPPAMSTEQLDAIVAKVESRIENKVGEVGGAVSDLGTRLEAALDSRERAFDLRSKDILKTVSHQLNGNTQHLLVETIKSEFDKRLVPVISERTTQVVTDHLNSRLNNQVSQAVQREVAKAVPAAVSQTLQSPDIAQYTSQLMSDTIGTRVQELLQSDLTSRVFPAFQSMAESAVTQAQRHFEQKLSDITDDMEYKLRTESQKVDHLVDLVQNLSDTMKTMATTQSQFQAEILKLQQRQFASPAVSSGPSVSMQPQVPPKPSLDPGAEQAMATIDELMQTQQHEAALVRWLQCQFLNEVFENYFFNKNAQFLTNVSPLVQLSVAAAVSEHLSHGKTRERILWLDTLVHSFYSHVTNHMDDQVREITPKIMGMVVQRVQAVYLDMTRQTPQDPMLKTMGGILATGTVVVQETKGTPSNGQTQQQQQQPQQLQQHQQQQPQQHQQSYQMAPAVQYEQQGQYQGGEMPMQHHQPQPGHQGQVQPQWY